MKRHIVCDWKKRYTFDTITNKKKQEEIGMILGIDLGTSTSEMAYLTDGLPMIIPNKEMEEITPSVIGINDEGDIVVGNKAKQQLLLRPENTVYEVKRLMGTTEPIQLGERTYLPEEIQAHILRYLKESAEDYLKQDVEQVVITVPAYFNDHQRKATIKAGTLAGLKVERIINEPTAAALTYGIEHMEEEQHLLIYDLGGGTFDVTLLEMFDGILEVKASSGNNALGGKDFDERIIKHLLQAFKDAHGINLAHDVKAMAQMKEAAEACKIALSQEEEYIINIPFIAQKDGKPVGLKEKLTRKEFESIISDLIDDTQKAIDVVIEDGKIEREDIDLVILVGGSTRIPYVQHKVEIMLGQEPKQLIDPDKSIAMGAAIQGGILSGQINSDDGLMITDVSPYTLGIEVATNMYGMLMTDIMDVIIPRNTTIPVIKEEEYTTLGDQQEQVEVVVYQGNDRRASDNHLLGEFMLSGIPPAPAGTEKINISFSYDNNGILHIEGRIISTGKKASVSIDMAGIEEEIDVDLSQWNSVEGAKKYRYIIKKALKVMQEIENETLKDELEGLVDCLKRALVVGESDNVLDELEEEIAEILYDIEEELI